MDIKCRKLTCKYNTHWVCSAPKVNIQDNTDCKTFENAPQKNVQDNTKTLFTKTPVYENYRHIKDVNLMCQAKCFFNCKKECFSNGITILCGTDTPICGTFLKK